MDADEPLTRAEGKVLLEYAHLTYDAVTSYRRRLARIALGMAAIVGVLCIFSATQWLSTSNRVSEVGDETLVEAMGVQIPDPRPALERGQLRVIATLWEFVTIASGVITVMFLAAYALARPPRLPRHLRAGASYTEPGSRRPKGHAP